MATSNEHRDQEMADDIRPEDVPDAESGIEVDAEASELEQVTAERDSYLDQLQRSRAEFINYRKRMDAERTRLGDMFTANALSQFLPVIDDFDRALAAVPDKDKDSGWLAGITMIHTKLLGILERAGVERIDAVNAPFDPAVHEAVATEPGTSGDTVVEIYQKGYKLGDTLLRAAMVKTGDASPTEQDQDYDA